LTPSQRPALAARLPAAVRRRLSRLLRAELAAEAEAGLAAFVRQAWPLLEPSTPLVWGWHMDAMCRHLEAVSAGQVANLVIEIPPGCSKSTVVSVCWPVWHWLARPAARFLTASYAMNLAIRDALRSRRVLLSPWFRGNWGGRFRLAGDQNMKSRYDNDRTGYRISLSVGSATTGERGDLTVIDDPHNVTEAESEASRLATLRWHDEAFYNRINDARRGGRVVIGQRVHHRDLIGHLLAQGGFEELRIPEEFEADRRCATSIGWADPRTEEGELMRPERFGPAQVAEAKRRLGATAYGAQHQQNPTPREGALFRKDWLARRFTPTGDGFWVEGRFWPLRDCRVFATMDPAGGESGSADYTAVGVFAVTPANDLLVVYVLRERIPLERIVPRLKRVCDAHRPDYAAVEVGFFQGKLAEQAMRTPGMPPVRQVDPGGRSKAARALPAMVRAEAGQVYLPDDEPGWLGGFVAELLRFTGVDDDHDDQVDCLSYAVQEWEFGYGGDDAPASGRRRGG
jgi:predicted phage terminase large subunit-like protein